MKTSASRGFTIIELLVVVAIIGILATVVLTNFKGAQTRARISRAESALQNIEKAIVKMSIDVEKWPNGCTVGIQSNPEVDVSLDTAGLAEIPPVGYVDVGCDWTNGDLANWSGPYISADDLSDPWSKNYLFDPDYYPWQSCSSKTALSVTSVVVSHGPDGVQYTCDDIYRKILF